MAAPPYNSSKMISAQLRNKANEFLDSRKHANNLADILQMFEMESDNYTPVLLTIEVIFTELLKRGDLFEEIVPLKPNDVTPEGQYKRWLRECYEAAWSRTVSCMTKARGGSRLQALVTACKLLQAEGRYPLEPQNGYSFPAGRLKTIFNAFLDSEILMSAPITRFQEFSEYKDVQQYGLKVLAAMSYRKSPTPIFMQNYLELLDKLLTTDIMPEIKNKDKDKDDDKEDKVLCAVKGQPSFAYNAIICRRHANRCWAFACQWPLCAEPRTQKRALLLLVEKLMPLLMKPHLATDMLCDSLDAGGPISMLALQGVLELVCHHNIDYPDIYERLYAMFEPEMFATRHKRRLLHLADIFLSSTHLPESLVAAFAKRLSRLALVAPPEDTAALLQLVANLLLRHPGLKRMICYDDTPAIMSSDPYVMEETSACASGALSSSLWEVSALRRHWLPAVASAADKVLAAADPRAAPVTVQVPDELMLFDAELKKRFKSIEMNFIRPVGASLPSGERLAHYWEIAT
ncbi:Nucleolar complex protein 4 homolog B [Eumeta japonica]|uniref:Nucleolar complex protein 4 homolog B n=1 Tax=Eumeta variegata TaxID=151549 RepID=A0A4C1T4N5_EUMVA|nr:Nucleolar complex protein 4 homolog B [Eumeta japonica]